METEEQGTLNTWIMSSGFEEDIWGWDPTTNTYTLNQQAGFLPVVLPTSEALNQTTYFS